MSTRSQRIEEIFQRVEEESERRAEQESQQPPQPASQDAPTGRRRGGSISVSRFGQPVQPPDDTSTTRTLTPPLSISTSAIRKMGLYGLQPHLHMGSADSLASNPDRAPDEPHDEELTTQVATISGRQSLSKAVGGVLGKKLSRSRRQSRDLLPPPTPTGNSMVIGVRVEERSEPAPCAPPLARAATVCAPAPALRHQKSHAPEKASAWVDKARDLTKKLRRKSAAALTAIPDC